VLAAKENASREREDEENTLRLVSKLTIPAL